MFGPTPLTPTGELHALLNGLAIFTAIRTVYGDAVPLNFRSAHRMTSRQPQRHHTAFLIGAVALAQCKNADVTNVASYVTRDHVKVTVT